METGNTVSRDHKVWHRYNSVRIKANTHQRGGGGGGGGGGEQVNTHQRGGGGGGEQGCGQYCDDRKHYELCILSLNYYIWSETSTENYWMFYLKT